MTNADRPALIRCTLFLSGLAWILPACVLGLAMWVIHDLSGVDPFASSATSSGYATMELGLSSIFKGHTLVAFSLALCVFAVFALGSLLAVLGMLTGRQAIRVGGATAPALVGVISAGLYLATLAGLVVGAAVA